MPTPPISPALGALRAPAARRLAVRVTPDALRHVRAGHPWVFGDSITSITGGDGSGGRAGDLAVVFDANRNFAAIGFYDPASPMRIKILHAGAPATIDAGWWRAAFDRALELRRPFTDRPDADRLGYRVVNGENDGLPGLIVDRYAGVLVVKLYTPALFAHLPAIVEQLIGATGCETVVLRMARTVQRGDTQGLADGDVVAGELTDPAVVFVESGLEFEADVRRGQKTGWFLDQRANRVTVGSMSAGRDVLDVFAAGGGFSVHAAAGGARSVHSVDLSAPTLAAAVRNMERNRSLDAVRACAHTVQVGDAFEVMAELARADRRFGIVVVDPPSFAQRQSSIDAAVRAYTRLTHLAVRLVEPDGVLVQASCSSRVTPELFFDTVEAAARSAGRPLTNVLRTGHDIDHPVGFAHGEYLKAGFWTVPDR
ncbi:MAG: class I SAM-dependent rRNA methyltransferase [Ilumatobacteraceae bacterium]